MKCVLLFIKQYITLYYHFIISIIIKIIKAVYIYKTVYTFYIPKERKLFVVDKYP